MAVGVIVAGLLHTPGESAPHDASAHTYVTPDVEYPVEIPGCETVLAPSEGEMFGVSFSGEQSYDNPRYPWFSGPKATAMSEALIAALPGSVELEYAGPADSLVFEPIPVYSTSSELPEGITEEDFGGSTYARGILLRDSARGSLSVSVTRWDQPVPECAAGQLDRRATHSDGTIIDTQDTWAEYDGNRNLIRTATAYLPDGTQVYASASDEDPRAPVGGGRYSGLVPLTIEELSDIVRTPGLRVTAQVPLGTPPPPTSCGSGTGSSGEPLTRESVERLGLALDDAWRAHAPEGVTLERSLGSLQPSEYGGRAPARRSVSPAWREPVGCTSISAPGTNCPRHQMNTIRQTRGTVRNARCCRTVRWSSGTCLRS
ncbi:hypothetical protein BTZ20_1913 [Rhodococcus sp. MTM3W5.2]|nr:hypothetical protein BTZ20_1913 [Rhodococcus sp. MTM3W5.2]